MQEFGTSAAMAIGPYFIITAAKNEESFIGETIEGVLAQTVRPRKWLIVSDGSTDRTDDIVSTYAAKYSFITLLRAESHGDRNFARKAKAINSAYEQNRNEEYEFVAILDGDVALGPNYYEHVLAKFNEYQDLGISGGILRDRSGTNYVKQRTSTDWSVSGPIQVFRRKCFEEIGGYFPVSGGIDAVAEVMARMSGWKVMAFPHIQALHNRPTGRASQGMWRAAYRNGEEDYLLGYHPLFFVARCAWRISARPYLVGSATMFLGYLWAWIRGRNRVVADDFVEYLRREQVSRLLRLMTGKSGAYG
jgi:glycosyltransferase involved in cell wall biosynthesis